MAAKGAQNAKAAEFLWAAMLECTATGAPEIARAAGEALVGRLQRTTRAPENVLAPERARTLCTGCGSPMVPGVTCAVRVVRLSRLGKRTKGKAHRAARQQQQQSQQTPLRNAVQLTCRMCGAKTAEPGCLMRPRTVRGRQRRTKFSRAADEQKALLAAAKKREKVTALSAVAQMEQAQAVRAQVAAAVVHPAKPALAAAKRRSRPSAPSLARTALDMFLKEVT